MRVIRGAFIIVIAATTTCGTIGTASARQVHRHRVVRHFVFASPAAAEAASRPGTFGGTFGTGILGASIADPYTRPAYGYDGRGYYGPGFGYPGY